MYERNEQAAYRASEIAHFLKRDVQGDNCLVKVPRSATNPCDNSVIFVDNVFLTTFDYSSLDKFRDVLLITNHKPDRLNASLILSPTPRLDFVRTLHQFFVRRTSSETHATALIHPKARLGKNVTVGAHSVVGPDVSIADDTEIHQNVVISGVVRIGKRCVIKANSTIGSEGFSFVLDSDRLEHFPQIGEIVIGDDVWIGANSTVERSALDETVIEDGVKIDDLVQIGHGARIGRLSSITSGVVVCGRASIGERCWLAPNSCIDVGISIGARAFVGMGAVVTKNLPENVVATGKPARVLRERREAE